MIGFCESGSGNGQGLSARRAGGVCRIAAVDRRQGVRTRRAEAGGKAGRSRTQSPGAERGGAVLERHRAGGRCRRHGGRQGRALTYSDRIHARGQRRSR